MSSGFSITDGPDLTCRKCGSLYSSKVRKLPVRDKDDVSCQVCGEILDSWNSTHVPEYTLVKKCDDWGRE